MNNIIYNFSKREEKKKLYSMVNIIKTGNNKNISTDYGNKRKNVGKEQLRKLQVISFMNVFFIEIVYAD